MLRNKHWRTKENFGKDKEPRFHNSRKLQKAMMQLPIYNEKPEPKPKAVLVV